LNLYNFILNNPINDIDPYGLIVNFTRTREWIFKKVIAIGNIAPGLPQRILRHYIFGQGNLFMITKNEILYELKPRTSLFSNLQFKPDLINAARKGEGLSKRYNLPSTTSLPGSLGNFTTEVDVEVDCVVLDNGILDFVATGNAKVKDYWDFDWKLGKYILGVLNIGSGNGRSWYGQWRTMAGSMIPGDSFYIDSEAVRVRQKSGDQILTFEGDLNHDSD